MTVLSHMYTHTVRSDLRRPRELLGLARLLSHVSATFLLFFCTTPLQRSQKTLAKVPDAVTIQPAASRGSQSIFYCKIPLLFCTYSILLFVLCTLTLLRTAKAYYLQSVLSRYDCTKISSTVQGQYNGASVLNYFAKNLFGRCAAV